MAKQKSPDVVKGGARAALGQGLLLGWGDEAEAWLRSKLGDEDYRDALNQIRREYGEFSQAYPVTSTLAEFGGGVAPGVAAMFVPGLQPVAATQVGRTTAAGLGKLMGLGAATGAVAGAGAADEESRGSGAISGGVLGGGLGLTIPVAQRSARGARDWLRERLGPSAATVENMAAEKMTQAMRESGLTPKDITQRIAVDRSLGVPSVVANVDPALADLAQAVAQRTGAGARKVESQLTKQKLGSRERTYQQTIKGLSPGDYYTDFKKLQDDLRTKAEPFYKQAYEYGKVTDPRVLDFLNRPQFKKGIVKARELLAAEGRELPTFKMVDQVTGKEVETVVPTVETLDQIKRGIDRLIERETDSVTGKVSQLGKAYIQSKNEFLAAIDEAVPAYKAARAIYRGDAEIMDALNSGLKEFGRLDHEQVIAKVAKMSDAERQAYRTGVARGLYSTIMDPSGNFNSAQRIIGSPEMQAKLQPLFDNPAQFNLFKAALERESQLFHQANAILGGSQTGKRTQMREALEETSGVGLAIEQAVTGGFWSSLTNAVARGLRSGLITEEKAARMADMLMSKDPAEVAAVVKILENYAQGVAPRAVQASRREAGAVTGTVSVIQPAPESPARPDIESELSDSGAEISGPDIEADLEAETKSRR